MIRDLEKNAFAPGMTDLPAATLEAMRQEAIRTSSQAEPGAEPAFVREAWLALLDDTGKTPYVDERYWVKRAKITNAAGDNTAALTIAALAAPDPRTLQVTATNPAEWLSGTHLLVQGTPVWVIKLRDQQTPSVEHYVLMCGGGAGLAIYKITDDSALEGVKLTGIPAGVPSWSASAESLLKLGAGYLKTDDTVLVQALYGYLVVVAILHRTGPEA